MSLVDYIRQCERNLEALEIKQDYLVCASLRDFIVVLKNRDVKAYIEMCFDVKTLQQMGFFPKRNDWQQMEKQLVRYFGYESIFDYSTQADASCPFQHYVQHSTWEVYPGLSITPVKRKHGTSLFRRY